MGESDPEIAQPHTGFGLCTSFMKTHSRKGSGYR
jgi:hypothetical protein